MNADRRTPSPRWLRILAIAVAALILASCRPVSASAPESWDRADKAGDILQTGLETPCPPLPRVGGACAACGERPAASHACPTCAPPAPCPPPACLPPAVPLAAACPLCNGGDHGAPAKPEGAEGLANLTAGDVVARYRAADDGPDADCVHIAVSSCACVFAPRFAAVRQVVRPFEEAAPQGPRGLALDEHPDEESLRLPVIQRTQTLQPEAARQGLPGMAIQERLGPLAVDQDDGPREQHGLVQPAARISTDQPEWSRQAQRPIVVVGFDVPVAWTCVKAANVLVDDRSAAVVAADRGTATLRFESPGRAELTLCKRAGSDTARPGEELDFTIYMLNSGDRPLSGIVLADALPERLSLVEGSAAASVSADFSTGRADDGATVLTWRLRDSLAPGASGFVRFRTFVR